MRTEGVDVCYVSIVGELGSYTGEDNDIGLSPLIRIHSRHVHLAPILLLLDHVSSNAGLQQCNLKTHIRVGFQVP